MIPPGKLLNKSWPTSESANIPYAVFLTPCCTLPKQEANGDKCRTIYRLGRSVITISASAVRWKWRNDGTWQKLNKALVERRRKKAKREASPSVGIIDSQSVKCSEWGVVPKGYDGHKKVNGRKRHIVVDTLGLVLVVVVHAANIHDSPAARLVLSRLAQQGFERLGKILADSAYGQKLAGWMKKSYGLILEVVRVSELAGFQVIPMRWKVERTFAWMNWSRRLSKDYECGVNSHESFVYLSNINRMLKHF